MALLTLKGDDQLCEHVGRTRGQEVINSLGSCINKHFSPVGGFSARQSKNQFATFLPYSDLQEAERILRHFAADLQEERLRTIQTEAHIPREMCFESAVLAGLAEGTAGGEYIDHVFKKDPGKQQEIARVHCEKRG